jgi:beta-lactam-binding protein with PASTA domain
VIGRPAIEAVERLRAFRVERREVASVRKAGEVIDQEPRPPAQRPAGSAVRIDVSDGSRVLVPPVRNRKLADARARLATNGLVAELKEQAADEAPGLVTSQEPVEGSEVARGSSIALVVSSGIAVPDVRGESLQEARRRLVGFNAEHLEVQSGELKGAVVEQDPAPGVRVAAGTRIRLNISDGTLVNVPDLQGVKLGAARSSLRDAGLQASVRSWPDHADAVIKGQTPAPRTVVQRSTLVQLEVRPPTAWYVAGWTLFLLATALGIWWVRRRPAPIVAPAAAPAAVAPVPAPVTLPPVRVTASVPDADRSRIDGAVSIGPNVRVAARIEGDTVEVKLDNGKPDKGESR